MALTKEMKEEVVRDFGDTENDTGKTEVQIALITRRIAELTEHFKVYKKDNNSKRSLLRLVGKRRKLLKYLQKSDVQRYRDILQKLSLRK